MPRLSRPIFHVLALRSYASIVCASVVLSACAGESSGRDEAPTRESRLSACRHDLQEPDLEAAPLAGPGVDPTTGRLRPPPHGAYVVSATYGVPRPSSDGAPVSSRYVQLFAAIEAQLARETGLMALQLGTSAACGSGRTLAVWESEEQMYAFVTSPAHREAMAAAREVLLPGYAVTHWETRSAAEISMEEAVRQLGRTHESTTAR